MMFVVLVLHCLGYMMQDAESATTGTVIDYGTIAGLPLGTIVQNSHSNFNSQQEC